MIHVHTSDEVGGSYRAISKTGDSQTVLRNNLICDFAYYIIIWEYSEICLYSMQLIVHVSGVVSITGCLHHGLCLKTRNGLWDLCNEHEMRYQFPPPMLICLD